MKKGHVLTSLSQRSEAELSMIDMDLDHFKNINDTFGHAAGDLAEKLFKGAEQHLYQAKDSGRNCVVTVGCVIY